MQASVKNRRSGLEGGSEYRYNASNFEKVVLLADKHVNVDGVEIDLRGRDSGTYVYEKSGTPPSSDPAWRKQFYASVRIEISNNDIELEVEQIYSAAATMPDDVARADISTYPNYLVWESTDAQAVPTNDSQWTENYTESASTTAKRTAWFKRLGTAYKRGMDDNRYWWWKLLYQPGSDDYWRATDIGEVEIPNWLKALTACVAAAISGRTWTSMTDKQIEACIAHFEAMLEAGIIDIWYKVGKTQTTSSSYPVPNSGSPARNGTAYASATTFGTNIIYTDMYEVSSNILVPRTPDYSWLPIICTTPANFDPENPA